MRPNKEIINQYSQHYVEVGDEIERGVSVGCAIHAMKQAQVEAIKEYSRKLKIGNFATDFNMTLGEYFFKADDIALELIKDIENGI